jgi:hypothetical protein
MWAQAKQDDERLYLRRYAYYAKDHDLPQVLLLQLKSFRIRANTILLTLACFFACNYFSLVFFS